MKKNRGGKKLVKNRGRFSPPRGEKMWWPGFFGSKKPPARGKSLHFVLR